MRQRPAAPRFSGAFVIPETNLHSALDGLCSRVYIGSMSETHTNPEGTMTETVAEEITAETLAEDWGTWAPAGAIKAWLDLSGIDAADATEDDFQDAYRGEYDSAKTYAEEVVDEYISAHGIELPQMFNGWGNLLNYIDYETIANELDMAGVNFEDSDDYTVYVFDF